MFLKGSSSPLEMYAFTTACTAVYILACVVSIQGVTYKELEDLGIACQGRDSCVRMSRINKKNFFKRNCACDQYCSAFGDCCLDARSDFWPMDLTCMNFGGVENLGAYVIDRCLNEYSGPAEIIEKCSMGSPDFSDPLAAAPVTILEGGVTYRNRYCAECNNIDPTLLTPWTFLLDCETLALHDDVNETFAWNNLEYRDDEGNPEWGVRYRGEFHYCDILFNYTDALASKLRFCHSDVIASCPPDWVDTGGMNISHGCRSYTAVVYTTEKVYKNGHCAICNRETSRRSCSTDSILFRRRKPFSFNFADLVDVNQGDGDYVGEISCPAQEVYDQFFKKCRPISCIFPGYEMVEGQCVKGAAID